MKRRLGSSAEFGSLATWQRYTLYQLPGIAVVCALATLRHLLVQSAWLDDPDGRRSLGRQGCLAVSGPEDRL